MPSFIWFGSHRWCCSPGLPPWTSRYWTSRVAAKKSLGAAAAVGDLMWAYLFHLLDIWNPPIKDGSKVDRSLGRCLFAGFSCGKLPWSQRKRETLGTFCTSDPQKKRIHRCNKTLKQCHNKEWCATRFACETSAAWTEMANRRWNLRATALDTQDSFAIRCGRVGFLDLCCFIHAVPSTWSMLDPKFDNKLRST